MQYGARLFVFFLLAVSARGEDPAYYLSGKSSIGTYELSVTGIGARQADGGYAKWKVDSQVNGVRATNVISNAQFNAGYATQGLLVQKASLDGMKSRGTPLDNAMNGSRAAGVAAAQHYADRVAPKEYQLPPTGKAGTTIIGADAGTHALQTAREIGDEMFRATSARTAYERDQAASMGFDNVNKYKAFLGQNRSKIRAAAKAGSADPVGDVLAERSAARAVRDNSVENPNSEVSRMHALGSPEERIAAAAGTAEQQQAYFNALASDPQSVEIRKSWERLKARRAAEAKSGDPVFRIRRMREAFLGSVQAVPAKRGQMVASDSEAIALVINETAQLQDAFRALPRQPQLRPGSPVLQDKLIQYLKTIVEGRMPTASPLTDADVRDVLAVLEALEAVAGMDLIY